MINNFEYGFYRLYGHQQIHFITTFYYSQENFSHNDQELGQLHQYQQRPLEFLRTKRLFSSLPKFEAGKPNHRRRHHRKPKKSGNDTFRPILQRASSQRFSETKLLILLTSRFLDTQTKTGFDHLVRGEHKHFPNQSIIYVVIIIMIIQKIISYINFCFLDLCHSNR